MEKKHLRVGGIEMRWSRYLNCGVAALVCIATNAFAAEPTESTLVLKLTLDATHYDPTTPRSVPIVVTVTNPTEKEQRFFAPEVFGGMSFRALSFQGEYRSHPMWLMTGTLYQRDAEAVVLKPNESRVMFRTDISEILPSGPRSGWRKYKPFRWRWTWGAKSYPPSSPVVPAKPTFPPITQVAFWAQLTPLTDSLRSNVVMVTIPVPQKSTKSDD